MRCPFCSQVDDKVVDSRLGDDGAVTRRRRECLTCARRFTTYERLEDAVLVVLKRSGDRQPFDRDKLVFGLRAASKNRPAVASAVDALATDIEEAARLEGPEVASDWLGQQVLARLRELDEVSYLRFASVHKSFSDAGDFGREAERLAEETKS